MKFIPLILLLLTGCVGIPSTVVKMGGDSIVLPKNHTAKNIDLEIRQGTNIFRMKADYITSKNDPHVISASAEAQADVTKAHYNGISQLLKEVKDGAAKTVVP
jgi:hypothetical protein